MSLTGVYENPSRSEEVGIFKRTMQHFCIFWLLVRIFCMSRGAGMYLISEQRFSTYLFALL